MSKKFLATSSETKILREFEREISDLKVYAPIIEVVCNKGLKDVHWKSIQSIINFKFDHEKDALEDLLEEGQIQPFMAQIQEISE